MAGLAQRGFAGSDWEYVRTELARYGVAVIGGWTRRGLILSRCKEKGYGGLPEPPEGAFDDPTAVADVSHETVAVALQHFRDDVLVKGRWDPKRGASLRTYFIGQCLIRFPNVYRSWWRQRREDGAVPTMAADHESLEALSQLLRSSGPGGVEAVVVDRAYVARLLQAVRSPRTREALVLSAAGWSYSQIGVRLGMTAKAVERMVANERSSLKLRGVA